MDSMDATTFQTTSTADDLPYNAEELRNEQADSSQILAHEYYAEVLNSSEAYKWLLANLRRDISLRQTEPDHQGQIRKQIIGALPRQRVSRRHSPPEYDVCVELAWDALGFFERQQYKESPHQVASQVIVLIGLAQDAQATTCEKYMMQTWPSTGKYTMQCFVECLRSKVSRVACKLHVQAFTPRRCSNKYSVVKVPGSSLELRIEDRKVVGEIHGTKAFVSEISEQLAWLGAALQDNPKSSESLCYSEPIVQTSKPASEARNFPHNVTYSFWVRYLFKDFDLDTKHTYGQCWHGLFRNAVVVPGYPIPERSEDDRPAPGLEITLPMMAGLTRAQFLNSFHKTPMIKGFSTLLYPTRQKYASTTWHLIYNVDAKYMSFARGLSCFAPSFDLLQLVQPGHRHFLGWCRDARLFAGESLWRDTSKTRHICLMLRALLV